MKRTILIIAGVVLLGGIIHCGIGLSPLFFGRLTLNHLWFTAAGMSLILIAFINYLVVNIKSWQISFFVVGHITNILGSILLGAILCFLPAPHIALLFLLLVAETVLVVLLHSRAVRTAL